MAASGASLGYRSLLYADSFRLLLVQPAAALEADLECSLLHTTLSECDYDLIDPYTALSYVWGDITHTGMIRIDGHDVTVTATLEAALRDLRDGIRVRRVWADALCIDQSNIAERNQQVALMGRIYSTAHHTVIHLGTLTKEADRVLRAISPGLGGVNCDALSEDEDGASVVELAQHDLLTRPWFTRVWIFQELVLSKDPWVQCGNMRVRWTDFCNHLAPYGGERAFGNLQILAEMNMYRQNVHPHGAAVGTLFDLLISRRGLGATDPRDFIYAHLGLASDAERVSQYVEVDYTKPVGDTFGRAARYIFNTMGAVTAFSHIDNIVLAERRDGLPSWAPDWSRGASHATPMWADNMLSRLQLTGRYHAFTEEPWPPVLVHLGYQVDVLAEISAVLPPSSTIVLKSADQHQVAVSGLRALYGSVGGTYTSGDQFGRYTHINLIGKEKEHEALCRALCGAWLGFLRDLGPAKAEANRATHVGFVDLFEAWLGGQASQQRIFVGQDSDGLIRLAYIYFLSNTAPAVLDGRRLARTKRGRFAVVPAIASKGDIVTYLAGSDIAVLVRKRDDEVDVDHLGNYTRMLFTASFLVNATLMVSSGGDFAIRLLWLTLRFLPCTNNMDILIVFPFST
jgi:Heterokaryon incompatibility protein (HET)